VKSYPKIIDRILDAIRGSKTFCVAGHVRPDGDCVGSQLGLALALRNEGKKAVCWNEDSIPQKYKFLNADGLFQQPKRGMKFDCVIATDCASFERLGSAGKCILQRKVFINIDHHESNTRYADVNWVSAREPSCGELIYRLLKVARWPITTPPYRRTRARSNTPQRGPARFTSARNLSHAARTSRKFARRSINPIRFRARGCSNTFTANSGSPPVTALRGFG